MFKYKHKIVSDDSPFLLIFLLSFLFFYPVIFQERTFYAFDTLFQYPPWSALAPDFIPNNPLITDPVNSFYPIRHFLSTAFEKGAFSLWYDSNFCGTCITYDTFFTNPVVFLFHSLLSMTWAHDLQLGVLLFAAGCFMHLYLKGSGLGHIPALLGAIAWMFNGYLMVWFEFEHQQMLAAALPATLYFMDRWFKSRRLLDCLSFVCAISLSICSGASHFIYMMLFIVIYFFFKWIPLLVRRDRDREMGRRDIVHLLLALFIGVLISSSFFINSISLLDEPQRREFSFDELYDRTGQVPAAYLPTLIFPDFYGNPAGGGICFTPRNKQTQSYNNYNELCLYAGIVSLFLIVAGIPCWRTKKYALFFFFTALITAGIAMKSALYYPFARFVPGMNLSTPTRVLLVFGFALSVLTAIGADALRVSDGKKRHLIVGLWAGLVVTATLIALFVQTETGIRWASGSADYAAYHRLLTIHFLFPSKAVLKPLVLVAASFAVLLPALFSRTENSRQLFLLLSAGILAYDLISFGLAYNTASPKTFEFPETEAIRFLKKTPGSYRVITYGPFLHNALSPFGIADVGGYSSFYPRRYAQFLHLSQHNAETPFPDNFSRWTHFRAFGSPLIDLINAKYVLLPHGIRAKHPKLKLVYEGEIQIYENTAAFPRAFFVASYQLARNRTEAYQMLGSFSEKDFKQRVILETQPPVAFQDSNRAIKPVGYDITDISYRPNALEVAISAGHDGFLLISDTFHPSWQATVDGHQTKIFRANYIMRAIPLKAGDHRVVMTFHPRLILSGIVFTAAGWALLAVMIVVSIVLQRVFRKQSFTL